MKKFATILTAALMATAIAAPQTDLYAQSRTTSGSSTRSTSSGSSSTSRTSSSSSSSTRSSSAATQTRSTSTSSQNRTATTSSQTRSTSTSSQNRNTAATSSSSSRSTGTTSTSRSTGTSSTSRTTSTGAVSRSTTTNPTNRGTATTSSTTRTTSTTGARTSSTTAGTTNRTSATTSRNEGTSSTTRTTATTSARTSSTTANTTSRTAATSSSNAASNGDRRGATATTVGERTAAPGNASVADRPAAGTQSVPVEPVQVRPSEKLHEQPHQHPREREYISYRYVGHFWDPGHHCFGYRVMRIPSRAERFYHHNHLYYCFDGIYYRPYGSYYVVCRPPFEVFIDVAVATALDLYRCRFDYYYAENRIYDAVYQNNRYIDEQYEIIAKNNEIIAQQNAIIAKQNNAVESKYNTSTGRLLASEAFNSAQSNGLVQSYANANAEYYYQDGIFYLPENGKYKVIIPPAGAMVEYIPEDYEVVTLRDGNQYYKVDDTVYKVTVKGGVAYFEVMGQLYE